MKYRCFHLVEPCYAKRLRLLGAHARHWLRVLEHRPLFTLVNQ